jgi:multiple sugar transport system ATP-binding protein
MATITFEGVTKAFAGGPPAVAGLDLAVADGEFLVLVGPSGCGKTTALRMVAGLEDITAGRLLIGGRLANDASPRERDIAMVFQSYALYPHLSVAANIGFGLAVRGVATAEVARKVAEVAALLELGDYLDRRPGQLSGGQRQRVAMGRALVRAPNAFLMDEPLSNLDARLRGQMRAEIADLQKRTGVTTLYVTHDQVEAMTMGDRVAVMSRGVLQQLDAPRALYDRPANLFVAGFIGSPGMNFIQGRLSRQDGSARLRLGDHAFALPAGDGGAGGEARVVAGVRPEAFRQAGADEPIGTLPGTVAFVEDLGATLLAHVVVHGARVTTATDDGTDAFTASHLKLRVTLDPAQAVRPGDAIRLAPDVARLHLFDAATGQAMG